MSLAQAKRSTRREGGRTGRRNARCGPKEFGPLPPVSGGKYKPLTDHEVARIYEAALDVLEQIGMGDPTPELVALAAEKEQMVGADGRLRFSRSFIESVIDQTPKRITLHGRVPGREVELGANRVQYSSGGMAVRMVDPETGDYRPSTLEDLYTCARLVDALDHIQVFNRTVVATELTDLFEFDVNVAYACIAGTSKPIGTGFNDPDHIAKTVEMFDWVLGREGGFARQPFSTCNTCAIVPPLKFGEDNTTVAMAGARAGFPVKMVIAAQAGATAPASLVGTLVQTTAETLAGLAMVQLAQPGAPVIYGNWPFVSDLRTGAFSGGGGEEAVLSAAAVQIARHLGLPNCIAAGMTDAKEPDVQAGYEKGMTDLAAGLAGADIIYESAGMLASLIGCSLEDFVIDDEMLAAARQTIRGFDVNEDSLSIDVIRDAVTGPGHYLGHAQTLALMNTEYVYPRLADRSSPDAWIEEGRPKLRDKARVRVGEILDTHRTTPFAEGADERIRAVLPIRLPAHLLTGNFEE